MEELTSTDLSPDLPALTVASVATLLKVTPAHVRLLAKQGKLTSARTEMGRRLFSFTEVERYRAARGRRRRRAEVEDAAPAADGKAGVEAMEAIQAMETTWLESTPEGRETMTRDDENVQEMAPTDEVTPPASPVALAVSVGVNGTTTLPRWPTQAIIDCSVPFPGTLHRIGNDLVVLLTGQWAVYRCIEEVAGHVGQWHCRRLAADDMPRSIQRLTSHAAREYARAVLQWLMGDRDVEPPMPRTPAAGPIRDGLVQLWNDVMCVASHDSP